MRCEQCIIQNPSTSTSSSQMDPTDGLAQDCQSCSNNCFSGTIQAEPTKIKHLLITDPFQQLIMDCFPVKIEWSEILGRYLVATRDIRQSELIFQVQPIIAGPTPSYTENDWICMGCFRATKKKTLVRCPDCQWPFCSKECEGKDDTHKEFECLALAKAKVLPEDKYSEHITFMQLLRCLLLKQKDPEAWDQMLLMESHVDGRKNSTCEVWERWRVEEIKFIRDTLGLIEFDEDEINFVSGVLSMNAFGSNDIHGHRHRHGSYLYYLGAMAAHDCAPNTDYEVDENQDFNLKAIVDIPKGSQITLSYALPFQGTLSRRDYLRDYFFSCCCKRCADATEFGSYFSALKCSTCKNGWLLPDHPLFDESPWKCSEASCDGLKDAEVVNKLIKKFDVLRESQEYASDTNDFVKNIENMEKLLDMGEPFFHSNHFIMMGVEFEMIQKIQYYLEIGKLPWKLNSKLLQLTRKHIEIGQMIWPGWNDRYGRLMYLLQAAFLNSLSPRCRKECSLKPLKPEITQQAIQEVMRIRIEARKILLSKPLGSYEHNLGLKLKRTMDMESTVADLVTKIKSL